MIDPISIGIVSGSLGLALAIIIGKILKDERFNCESDCKISIKRMFSKRFKKNQ
jgi:hypothetical protein